LKKPLFLSSDSSSDDDDDDGNVIIQEEDEDEAICNFTSFGGGWAGIYAAWRILVNDYANNNNSSTKK